VLTTNFDTCLPDAVRERQPHIRHIHEVNRSPGDYDPFNVYSKCQIVFTNPGALTQKVAGKVTVESDGRIILSEGVTDQRNPSLCDIFFGISAMERAGTGLMDVGELMLAGGGASGFYHNVPEARFKAVVSQPIASAGSRLIARSDVPRRRRCRRGSAARRAPGSRRRRSRSRGRGASRSGARRSGG
jgi:hypothetical protein